MSAEHTACDDHGAVLEHWRPIPGYEGYYEASCIGRVRSLDRLIERPIGRPQRRRGHLMAQVMRNGYRAVSLAKDGARRPRPVHTVVTAAFHGPRPEGLVIRHLNGDNFDNRAENLTYGTASENARDTVAHGANAHARQTHCKHGHEFTQENVYHWRGARYCRTCRRDNWNRMARARRARQRAAA